MEALAAELDAEALVAPADMTVPADIKKMVDLTQERFGRIDVMCANAGIYIPGEFADGDIEELIRMLKNQYRRCLTLRASRHPADEGARRGRYRRDQLNLRFH